MRALMAGEIGPWPVTELGLGYRRYRLADETGEREMVQSLRRHGQITPLVVCRREETLEVLDGFKRVAAALSLGLANLRCQVLAADERQAKVALLTLHGAGKRLVELEEAWLVQALVREDGMSQVEVGELLGRHKSWVCRRLALLEKLVEEVRQDLRLGLVSARTAPACDFQTDPVVYRTVDAEGFVAWRGNRYALPYCHIGRLLPVRLSETALIVYGPDLQEIARHPLFARSCTGQQSVLPGQHPQVDRQLQQAQLQERFAALGPAALRFYEGLLKHQRYGRSQAHRVLALLAIYAAKDVVAALERAVRYGAFAADAVERILARSAQPRTALEKWAERQQEHLQDLLGEQPLSPRPAADYRTFFTEDLPHVETTPPTTPADADRSDNADPSDDTGAGPPPPAVGPPEQPEDRPGRPNA
jgi:ParB/RepB/Spo0J family partition protein